MADVRTCLSSGLQSAGTNLSHSPRLVGVPCSSQKGHVLLTLVPCTASQIGSTCCRLPRRLPRRLHRGRLQRRQPCRPCSRSCLLKRPLPAQKLPASQPSPGGTAGGQTLLPRALPPALISQQARHQLDRLCRKNLRSLPRRCCPASLRLCPHQARPQAGGQAAGRARAGSRPARQSPGRARAGSLMARQTSCRARAGADLAGSPRAQQGSMSRTSAKTQASRVSKAGAVRVDSISEGLFRDPVQLRLLRHS